MRPGWLVDFLTWQEFNHDWFYVEDRCSIDSIEFGDKELGAFDPNNATDGAPDTIGTIFPPLGEYTNGWPGLVVAWVTGTGDDVRRLDFVKEKQHLDMREFG